MRYGFALLLAASFLFFYRLDGRDLWNSHEGRAAQDAQTILDDGCWGLPRLYDGRAELQKPPLYYWAVAAVAWCRGGRVDAWSVRFPAAVSALGCVVAVWGFCVLRQRPVVGLVAAGVLATALHFTWLARVGRIDMPLTLAVTVCLGAFHLRREGGRVAWEVVAWLGLAVALLLKGPIGLVLPAAVVGLTCLWGLPLVAMVVLPWYVWAELHTNGELSRVFLWRHNFARGFDEAGGLRAHPWWFYGPQLLVDFLPWSPLVPVAVWLALRRGWRDPETRLGLVWFLVTVAMLSCVRFKRADYLLPAYPGAALLLGCAAERCWGRWTAVGFGAAVAACVAGWVVHVEHVLPAREPERDATRFAAAVRHAAPAPQPILFFRTESHTLAFHVGRPLHVLVQWQDLERWTSQGPGHVVMPRKVADEMAAFPWADRLEEVLDNVALAGGRHEKPLVLFRTRDDRPPETAPGPQQTAQPAAGGAE